METSVQTQPQAVVAGTDTPLLERLEFQCAALALLVLKMCAWPISAAPRLRMSQDGSCGNFARTTFRGFTNWI
jgi:hypothetical protein